MEKNDIAHAVLKALGGRSNILTNTVCMTRLRVTLANPSAVDYDQLNGTQSVLGTAIRGSNGVEVVFGPRMIDGIYHSFLQLTGIAAGTDALFPMSRQESNMRIHINPPQRSNKQPLKDDKPLMDDDELSVLQDIFGDAEDDGGEDQRPDARLLVVNGPNVNMLGLTNMAQPPSPIDYPSLLEFCKNVAASCGFSRCDCFQSNHEGDLIDCIQDAYGAYEGIVVNPGARTQLSNELSSAIENVAIPTIVVSISQPRDTSAPMADDIEQDDSSLIERIEDRGIDGYRTAIEHLANYLSLVP